MLLRKGLLLLALLGSASAKPTAEDRRLLQLEYDYIVVGGGVAGGVLATRLAVEGKQHGATVLVLETGKDETLNPLLQPSYFFIDSKHTHLYRNYFSQEGPQLNNRRLLHMSPKALGGGSAINAMVWTWGDHRDWQLWTERTGFEEWTFEDVKPYFQRVESYEHTDPSGLRGKNGPVHVSVYEPNEVTKQAAVSGSHVLNTPLVEDHNAEVHEGAAILQRNIRGNHPITAARQSSWVSFLQPANETQDNLFILEGSTVTRVVIDQSDMTATGVELLYKGECLYLEARKEVILSTGGHNTPKLMMLSGLGDETDLAEVGIRAIQHMPGVGKDMMDHINPGSLIFAGPPRQDYDGNLVACYARTGVVPTEITPDIEYGYIMGPADLNPETWGFVPSLHMFYVLMLNNDARGSIKLYDADPLNDPIIESGYLKSQTDRQKVVVVMRKLFEWASEMNKLVSLTQVMSGPYPLAITPESSDDEIIDVVRNTIDTHWHIANTCRMGSISDPKSVVDGHFRVHGIQRLRIVDSSAMPIIPNGHPMAALMMMAERAADWILEENHQGPW